MLTRRHAAIPRQLEHDDFQFGFASALGATPSARSPATAAARPRDLRQLRSAAGERPLAGAVQDGR